MLRAAARTPADVLEIVRAEAQKPARRKKSDAKSDAKSDKKTDRKTDKKTAGDSSKSLPRPKRTLESGSSVFAAAQEVQQAEPTKPEKTPATPARVLPRSQPARPAAPPTRAARPARPAAAPPARPASDPTPAAQAPAPSLSTAAVVLVAALLVCGAVFWQTQTLVSARDRPAAEEEVADDTARTLQSPAAHPNKGVGSLADLGENRVLCQTPRGDLVVLWRDPASGELFVERVYSLTHDPNRQMGDKERRYHGYHLDDLHRTRRDALRDAKERYQAAVELAATEFTKGIEEGERAAKEIVQLGGADYVIPYLEGHGAVYHRTATIGLAEAGFLCAIEPLLQLLEVHTGPVFRARLVGLLERLTKLELKGQSAEVVVVEVHGWLKKNPLRDPYQRVPGS